MSKINSTHRNPSAEDETPRRQLAGRGGRCQVVYLGGLCLQFGHPGSVEVHGHTGGAGSVTHLPQHAAPLLLIILVPNKTKSRVRSQNRHNGGQ